jgi:hypothetical protein
MINAERYSGTTPEWVSRINRDIYQVGNAPWPATE